MASNANSGQDPYPLDPAHYPVGDNTAQSYAGDWSTYQGGGDGKQAGKEGPKTATELGVSGTQSGFPGYAGIAHSGPSVAGPIALHLAQRVHVQGLHDAKAAGQHSSQFQSQANPNDPSHSSEYYPTELIIWRERSSDYVPGLEDKRPQYVQHGNYYEHRGTHIWYKPWSGSARDVPTFDTGNGVWVSLVDRKVYGYTPETIHQAIPALKTSLNEWWSCNTTDSIQPRLVEKIGGSPYLYFRVTNSKTGQVEEKCVGFSQDYHTKALYFTDPDVTWRRWELYPYRVTCSY